MLKIGIIGGLGKMGQQSIDAISKENDMEVAAVLDVNKVEDEVLIFGKKYLIENSLENASKRVDIFLDFTGPDSVKKNADIVLGLGKNLVIGATGLLNDDIENIGKKAEKNGVNVMVIPNFAIGAVLMMELSKKCAKYFSEVEIIEYHHTNKKDAPSGTAIKTAEVIKNEKAKRAAIDEKEVIKSARGAQLGDINIHSVRLNGYVASQEVIFGELGQRLAIRHDSISRESFMPGVVLAIRKVNKVRGLTYGLENIL